MKPRAAYQGSAGFTLVEALVATLLMTFIFAALATVTAQWLPNWNRGFIAMQRDELTATGLDRLTDDLAEAEFVSAGPTSNAPLFDGAELSVIFRRSKLAPNTGRGLEVVRIAEIGDNSGPALVRSTAPLPTGSGNRRTLQILNLQIQSLLSDLHSACLSNTRVLIAYGTIPGMDNRAAACGPHQGAGQCHIQTF